MVTPPKPGPPSGVVVPAPQQVRGDSKSASPVPLILALAFCISSAVLTIIFRNGAAETFFYVLGYLLTPFLVVLSMGFDTIYQRRNLSDNPWFIPKPLYSRFLRILVFVSFLLAIPHIVKISEAISEIIYFSNAGA